MIRRRTRQILVFVALLSSFSLFVWYVGAVQWLGLLGCLAGSWLVPFAVGGLIVNRSHQVLHLLHVPVVFWIGVQIVFVNWIGLNLQNMDAFMFCLWLTKILMVSCGGWIMLVGLFGWLKYLSG